MIRAAILILCAAALGGCAGAIPPPTIKTVTVDVPAPVPCVDKDSPPPPAYADTPEALRAAKDFAERDGLVKGEWARHRARESYLETLRAICMKVAPAP